MSPRLTCRLGDLVEPPASDEAVPYAIAVYVKKQSSVPNLAQLLSVCGIIYYNNDHPMGIQELSET